MRSSPNSTRSSPSARQPEFVRVVLDTNVCLDAFVFADPRAATLVAALASGSAEAITNEACRAEWLAVLRYPALKLDEASIATAIARFDAASMLLPMDASVSGSTATVLPRCRDPDDQKFLELAAISGADVLLSRDAEVLRLGARTKRNGLFAIMKPEDWVS